MSDRNRQNEPSNDPEIRAMMALRRALEPLSKGQRQRVMKWAEERFLHTEPAPDFDFSRKLMNATEEVGRQFGGMSQFQVVMALEAIVREHMRESVVLDVGDGGQVEVTS